MIARFIGDEALTVGPGHGVGSGTLLSACGVGADLLEDHILIAVDLVAAAKANNPPLQTAGEGAETITTPSSPLVNFW